MNTNRESRIVRLSQSAAPDAIATLGSKGYFLNCLLRAGYHVPNGFTISIDLAQQLEVASDDDSLWQHVWGEIDWLEQHTDTTLGNTERPLLLAVRSGAAVSMPGMLATFLGVGVTQQMLATPSCDASITLAWEVQQRTSTKFPQHDARAQLQAAIRDVVRSWRNPAAVAFRRQQGIDEATGTAVTIQQFVATDQSGVLFTRHPNPDNRGAMLAEFSEHSAAVVDGHVTPESCDLPREFTNTLDRDRPLPAWRELVDTALRIEREPFWPSRDDDSQAASRGLDIEWGWDARRGRYWIFQARLAQAHSASKSLHLSTADLASNTVYVRHDLNDSLCNPTPLSWSLVSPMFSVDGALGEVYRSLGYRPVPPIKPQESHSETAPLLSLVLGSIYIDATRAAQLFDAGLPFEYDLDDLAGNPELIESAPTRFNPDACGPWFLLQLPWRLLRVMRATRRASPSIGSLKRSQESVLRDLQAKTQVALRSSTLSTEALVDQLQEQRQWVFGELAQATLSWSIFAGLATRQLESAIAKYCSDPMQAAAIGQQLLTNLGEWPATPAVGMSWVISGVWTENEFVRSFAHRGRNEWELAAQPYRLAPPDFSAISSASDRVDRRESAATMRIDEQQRAWLISKWDIPAAQRWLADQTPAKATRKIVRVAHRAAALAPGRELARDVWLRGLDLLRQTVEHLAKRLQLDAGEPNAIFYFTIDELRSIASGAPPTAAIEARRATWRGQQGIETPAIIDTREASAVSSELSASVRDGSSGQALSSGTARGVARHIASLEEEARGMLRAGADAEQHSSDYILVCDSLDTGHLPYILRAQGIITARGGMLSHAAVVARQCQIPMVRLVDAQTLIRNGQTVAIDGNTGSVEQVSTF